MVDVHTYKVDGVKSLECPVVVVGNRPELSALLDLFQSHRAARIPLFRQPSPSWVMDFVQVIKNAESSTKAASQECLARI